MATQQRAYIGLGANEGEVLATLQDAVEALGALQQCVLAGVSPFYRSAPIDAEGPDFTNAVVAIDTTIEPYALLLALLDIELRLGRKRRGTDARLKAARRVDLDLLLHGPVLMRSTPLTLPHPRLHERAFVLRPLLDLAPDLELPGLGPAAHFIDTLLHQRVDRIESGA